MMAYLLLADFCEIKQRTPSLLNHWKTCFVSQHTVMGSEPKLSCSVFVYILSQCLQITSQKQLMAARALSREVGSPAYSNPIIPCPNINQSIKHVRYVAINVVIFLLFARLFSRRLGLCLSLYFFSLLLIWIRKKKVQKAGLLWSLPPYVIDFQIPLRHKIEFIKSTVDVLPPAFLTLNLSSFWVF